MSYTIECRTSRKSVSWRASLEGWPASFEAIITRAIRRIREEATLNYRIKDEEGRVVWEWDGTGEPPGSASPLAFVPHVRKHGRYRVVR